MIGVWSVGNCVPLVLAVASGAVGLLTYRVANITAAALLHPSLRRLIAGREGQVHTSDRHHV